MNINDFISKSKIVHENKYDYSKVLEEDLNKKVCIICPEHGEFWQRAYDHLRGCECKKCSIKKVHDNQKLTKEQFITKAKNVHGNKYDYSKVEYINNHTKVCIICPEHGEFWQTPDNHINQKQSCPKCSCILAHKKQNSGKDGFIEKARKLHGNKYDYSKVEYINNHIKVCIICPEHGEFWQRPLNHTRGAECPKCKKAVYDTETFIFEAKKIHGNKYDYSKVEYKNYDEPVCILDKVFGAFWQSPHKHLLGYGCYGTNLPGGGQEYFIKKSKQVHGEKYDYSKVKYKNYKEKVCIICPEHGEFWQQPSSHMFGKGCPVCGESKLEKNIRIFLNEKNISFEREKGFDWLADEGKMFVDFFLPEYNIGIECQGIQHFKPINFFGGTSAFHKTQERDKLKKNLCEAHNIKVFYYSNINEEYWDKVYHSEEELLEAIKNSTDEL